MSSAAQNKQTNKTSGLQGRFPGACSAPRGIFIPVPSLCVIEGTNAFIQEANPGKHLHSHLPVHAYRRTLPQQGINWWQVQNGNLRRREQAELSLSSLCVVVGSPDSGLLSLPIPWGIFLPTRCSTGRAGGEQPEGLWSNGP